MTPHRYQPAVTPGCAQTVVFATPPGLAENPPLVNCVILLQNSDAFAVDFATFGQELKRMLLGYARVSTEDQDTAAQVSALQAAGCTKIFTEKASGGRWDRPELHKLIDQLRAGDIVVTWKLDRLSRSLKDLLHIMERIDQAGAGFRSLTEHVDTTTPAGRMMLQMVGAFAEFERSMIRERTRAGLEEAKKRGVRGGRPKKLDSKQMEAALEMIRAGKSAAEVARLFKVHPATIGRHLAKAHQTA